MNNAEPASPSEALTFFSWGDGPFEKLDHITYSYLGWEHLASGAMQYLKASDHMPFWAVLRKK